MNETQQLGSVAVAPMIPCVVIVAREPGGPQTELVVVAWIIDQEDGHGCAVVSLPDGSAVPATKLPEIGMEVVGLAYVRAQPGPGLLVP